MLIADGHRVRPCMAIEGHSSFFTPRLHVGPRRAY